MPDSPLTWKQNVKSHDASAGDGKASSTGGVSAYVLEGGEVGERTMPSWAEMLDAESPCTCYPASSPLLPHLPLISAGAFACAELVHGAVHTAHLGLGQMLLQEHIHADVRCACAKMRVNKQCASGDQSGDQASE